MLSRPWENTGWKSWNCPAQRKANLDSKPTHVLLVEDDEDDYFLVRDWLAEIKETPFLLERAASFDEGLEAMRRSQHDVYLLDYRLGQQTGVELLRQATAAGCKGPVILLTGQGEREIDMAAMKAGAADYLAKDHIDAALLERSLRYAVQHQRDQEALRQAHADLEKRVRARTAELETANEALRTEIGERERAEKALRVQQQWLHVTLSSMGDAVIATDPE